MNVGKNDIRKRYGNIEKITNPSIIRERGRKVSQLSEKTRLRIEDFAMKKTKTDTHFQKRGREYSPENITRQNTQGQTGEELWRSVHDLIRITSKVQQKTGPSYEIWEGIEKGRRVDSKLVTPSGEIYELEVKTCGYQICKKAGYSPMYGNEISEIKKLTSKDPKKICVILCEDQRGDWFLSFLGYKDFDGLYGDPLADNLKDTKCCIYLNEKLPKNIWTKDLSDLIPELKDTWETVIKVKEVFNENITYKEVKRFQILK